MAKDKTGYTFKDKQGNWFARVTTTDTTGKRHQIKRRVKDRPEGKQLLKALIRQLEERDQSETSPVELPNKTFNDLCDLYKRVYLHEAQYVHGRKISGLRSVDTAERALSLFRVHFGARALKSITHGDLYQLRLLRLNTKTKFEKPRAISSVNREFVVLRRLLNIALRENWISRNPFNGGDSLISSADENKRERVLSREEETRLLGAVNSEPKRNHLRGVLLLALDCALRRGEILTLKWSDIDLARRTITVLAMNCKTARTRTVAMTIRVNHELQQLWFDSRQDVNALVFGIRVTVETSFKKACKVANLENFHLHDCRHTAITRMIRAGLPPVEVMRVSGHSTLACLYRYANLDSDAVFRAAAALDAYHAEAESQTSSASMMVN